MDRETLARSIYERTHLTGEFVLRSGAVSNEYFDKYRFESDPALLREIAEALAPLVPRDGLRLLVVEDVVTSGGQVITSCGDLRDRGAKVEHAVCVIDRQSGGPEGLTAIGVELHALYTMSELTS